MTGRVLSEEDIQMSERKVAVVPRAWKDDWQDLIATIRVLQTERDMYKQQKKYWRSLSDQFVDIIRDRDKTIAELREILVDIAAYQEFELSDIDRMAAVKAMACRGLAMPNRKESQNDTTTYQRIRQGDS